MRLIDADNYCENICRCNKEKCDQEKCPIHNAPTIEAVPVVHGEWRKTGDDELDNIYSAYKCSICGHIICGNVGNFCPNCGANMKGGKE